MLIIILLIWVVGSYGSANNTTTTASLAGCIDKSPYCNKNDCTIRPGYAIQFCHKTCSNCQPFCVESTIVACDQSVKDQCKDMLKEYCPVLCGICKIANKVANITEGSIPAVTVFNVNKSAIYDFDSQKMLKDDSGYTQKSIKLDNQWYINPNYKKPLPGLNNYPINNVPQNENHLEEEASSPDQLPFDSMTHLRRKNKKESDHKRRGYGGESGGNNQIQENGEIYEEEDDYEDYLKNSVPLAFHNKKRNKLKGRGDETNFNLRKPFHPPGFNQGLVVPTAAISDNQLIDEEQKNGKDLSLQEIDERVGNLPPFAFADLLTLLGCRDRDQHICSKITEEACKGRPGFYLKICPVKCKNCNGQTCIDSNKVDCAEVKSLGGCRLAIAEDYCPRTCSLCPSSSIIPQTQSICRDELDTCEQLAESGVCKNSASMPAMRVYCAKSCNWCKKTQIYVGTNEEGSLTSEINALLMLKKNDNVKRPFKLSKFRTHQRYKRNPIPDKPTLDLNTSVPYIFSARLYPYGKDHDDFRMVKKVEEVTLTTPLYLLGIQYDRIYIRKDGAIALNTHHLPNPKPFPLDDPILAVYWMKSKGGKVWFRETTEAAVLDAARNEVNIQYILGKEYKPDSVVIVTWENTQAYGIDSNEGNLFQVALILSEKYGSYGHIVYSKLTTNVNAIVGFHGEPGLSNLVLPGSGTEDAILLGDKSDIGIPGEWLFKLDGDDRIYLCGAGFRGMECVESCGVNQWGMDCIKTCHCESNIPCSAKEGHCESGKCNKGWRGAPICNRDIDECTDTPHLCPPQQPDCINTPGAHLCLCLDYNNQTKSCNGPSPAEQGKITLQHAQPTIMPLLDKIHRDMFKQELDTISGDANLSFPPKGNGSERGCKNVICGVNAYCEGEGCVCLEGFSGDGIRCEDKNECESGEHICGPHSECKNLNGSYSCICQPGFLATEDGCIDIDECLEKSALCGPMSIRNETTDCLNLIGSYQCQCKTGYFGNPGTPEGCIDIDECLKSENICGAHSRCKNLAGSFVCYCEEGYEKLSSNSTSCIDINECDQSPCHAAAVCTNLPGSFHCSCNEGFLGSGVECRETILYAPSDLGKTVELELKRNSIKEVSLGEGIKVFGDTFLKMFVSTNGIISFGKNVPSFEEMANSSTALIPLSQKFDLTFRGNVFIRKVDPEDKSGQALLLRSNYNVNKRFNAPSFATKYLYIITYEEVASQMSGNPSTMQVIISSSGNETFVTYLYESIGSSTVPAKSGIYNKGSFYELNSDLLLSKSNIKQPGKWIFKIDDILGKCPLGTREAPFCTKDCESGTWGNECASKCNCAENMACDFITGYCPNAVCGKGYMGPNCLIDVNECESGLHKCFKNAHCINKQGSYECQCPLDMFGDGFNCQPINGCFTTFGRNCSGNAFCQTSNGSPVCTCLKGYIGDGFICISEKKIITDIWMIPTKAVQITTEPTFVTKKLTSPPSLTFAVNATVPIHEKNGPTDITHFVENGPTTAGQTFKTLKPLASPPPLKQKDPPIVVDKNTPNTSNTKSTDKPITAEEAKKLLEGFSGHVEETFESTFYYIAVIIVIIWIIILACIVVICLKKRKNSISQKYETAVIAHRWNDQPPYTSPRANNFSQFSYT